MVQLLQKRARLRYIILKLQKTKEKRIMIPKKKTEATSKRLGARPVPDVVSAPWSLGHVT